jgi:hypothetical protein
MGQEQKKRIKQMLQGAKIWQEGNFLKLNKMILFYL